MDLAALDLPPRPGLLRAVWLPLLLSAAVHGLFLLLLLLWPAHNHSADDRPLPVEACVLVGDFDAQSNPEILAPVGDLPIESVNVLDPPASFDPSPLLEPVAIHTTPGVGGPGAEINPTTAIASLQQLPDTVRFQVILYKGDALPLRIQDRTDLVPATDENKRAVESLLEQLRGEGSTNHSVALKRALALDPDVIFFITDADTLTAQEIEAVTRQNHGRTSIHAIELTRSARGASHEGPLALLARTNRGTYRRVRIDGN
jgi:hypothetical protein